MLNTQQMSPHDKSAANSALHGAIADFAALASYEIPARDLPGLEKVRGKLPAATEVFISWMPGDSDDDRVISARAVRSAGWVPVPHIAVRRLAYGHDVAALLKRLHDEAGVTQILLIAGDVPKAEGPYSCVMDLLTAVDLKGCGIQRLYFAGHPEAHPVVPVEEMNAALDAKLAFARDHGFEAAVATQFAFEAAPFVDWLIPLRARWPDVPVRLGLAGPASIKTLLRYAKVCGVGNSMRGLTKMGTSLARMLGVAGPDPVIRPLVAVIDELSMGDISPHLFSFGGLDKTALWMRAVADGRFVLADKPTGGFKVEGF